MSVRVSHVNLPVPHGRSAEVADFYETVIGLTRAERPDAPQAGAWLDVGDGTQVHLSERDGSPHPDQHVAFVVDDLDRVRARARDDAGWVDVSPGRAVLRDPAGNLIELFTPATAPG